MLAGSPDSAYTAPDGLHVAPRGHVGALSPALCRYLRLPVLTGTRRAAGKGHEWSALKNRASYGARARHPLAAIAWRWRSSVGRSSSSVIPPITKDRCSASLLGRGLPS